MPASKKEPSEKVGAMAANGLNTTDPELELLWQKLRALWRYAQEVTAHRFMRTLGFGDYLVDRWEKARVLGFGQGTSIYESSVVIGNVEVGENTWIGPFTLLDGSGGLKIGSNCSISAGVQIYSHDSVRWAVSGGQEDYERLPVFIGSNCYIGPNTIIAKGVAIGDGCIIGAGSLVLRSIPANSKAFGSPCKVVGKVDLPHHTAHKAEK